MRGKVHSVNINTDKHTTQKSVKKIKLLENTGVEGDFYARDNVKQIALMSWEAIQKQNEVTNIHQSAKWLKPGDFAENITTEGIDLANLNVADKLVIGSSVVLEVTRVGAECHRYLDIHYKKGECDIPKEAVFAKVLNGGIIKDNDPVIRVQADEDYSDGN